MHRTRAIPAVPPRLLLALACLVASAAPLPALAQGTPRSVSECERLKNDLAYNQCLAMFGPEAKNVGGADGASSSPASVATALAAIPPGLALALPMAGERAHEAGRVRHGRRGRHARGGRQSASFAVGGETRGYRRHRRRR